MDVKHATLVTTTSCILHNFCCMNLDVRCIGVAGMQDPHSHLDVNSGIPTRITSQ